VNPVAVCTQAELVTTLTTGGVHVVLCAVARPACPPHTESASPRSAARPGAPEPTIAAAGRVALFVGDPDRPEVMEAAVAMARELFGAEPVIVRTAAEGGHLLAGVPGSQQT
jgi:hypothetical protein